MPQTVNPAGRGRTPLGPLPRVCHNEEVEEHPRIATGRLLHWRRQGALPAEAYQRAIDWATRPQGKERWSEFLGRWLLILGLALVTAGILFFTAYNWAELSRFQKFGLLQMLIVAAVLGVWVRGIDSLVGQVLWGSAAVLVGVLLAVYGQVYQTGADAYSLFLGWSLLTLPWCLVARSNFQWLLQAVLVNTTFILWWNQTLQGDFATFAIVYLGFNLGGVLLWQQRQQRSTWMQPGLPVALLINGLTPITLAGCISLWEGDLYLLDLLLTLTVLGYLVYRHRRVLGLMTVVAASGLTLGGALLVRLFIEWDFFGLLLVAVGVLAEVALAVNWLKRLRSSSSEPPVEVVESGVEQPHPTVALVTALAREQLLNEEQARLLQNEDEETPWFVKAVTGVGAWIASWFLLGFFAMLISDSESMLMAMGLVLCAATVAVRSSSVAAGSEFWQQVCLSTHLAGQLMAVLVFAFESKSALATGMLLLVLEGACIYFYPDPVARFLFTNAFVLGAGLTLGELAQSAGWELLVVGVAGAIMALWLDSGRWLKTGLAEMHEPVVIGLVTSLFALLMTAGMSPGWFMDRGPLSVLGLTSLTLILSFLLGAPVAALVGLGALGALTWTVPGLMAALLVMMLSFHADNKGGQALALAFLVAFGSLFYYNLEMSFVLKSATLIGSGLLLVMIRGVVARAS